MAKQIKRGVTVQRQGRRVMPAIRRKGARATVAVKQMKRKALTLGELIAAAFDAVGTEVKDVAKVLSSPEMAVATGKRIVLV